MFHIGNRAPLTWTPFPDMIFILKCNKNLLYFLPGLFGVLTSSHIVIPPGIRSSNDYIEVNAHD